MILNHQNHSKWLLTETQMYYGSSNFTDISWRDRVEVVSLHDHADINSSWSGNTVRDFYDFIRLEIATLTNPTRRMRTYRGLLTSTRQAWNNIRPLILRLNPSIEKVRVTLSNFDHVQIMLKEQVQLWFLHYDPSYFETIFRLSTQIAQAIDDLCAYAYAYIYNESVAHDEIPLRRAVVNTYNRLHDSVHRTIDAASQRLPEQATDEPISSDLSFKNNALLIEIQSLITDYLNPEER